MSVRSTLSTIVISAGVGAALGLLLAPSSSKGSRKKMRKQAESAKDSLACMLMEAQDCLDQIKKQAQDTVVGARGGVAEASRRTGV